MAGQNEDARADDGADAQRDQMDRAQRPLRDRLRRPDLSGIVRAMTSPIACRATVADAGTMAERLVPVQPPNPGFADFAVFQFARGRHIISGKPLEAGFGEIAAAGIAQQNVGLAMLCSHAISRSASGRS